MEVDFGLHVSQATGHLKELNDEGYKFENIGTEYDRFDGLNSPQEIVAEFARTHSNVDSLNDFKQKLDPIFGVTSDTEPENLPDVYVKAVEAINSIIDSKTK